VKEEVKRQEEWSHMARNTDQTAKQAHQRQHPEVTEMMDLWVSQVILLTGEVLCQKWVKFAKIGWHS
jgi:hypothetical protein